MKQIHLLVIIVITLIVAVVASLYPNHYNLLLEPWDKVMHFSFYAFFIVMLFAAIKHPTGRVLAIIALLLLSTSMEYLQNSVDGRRASWGDIVANVSGLIFGATLFLKKFNKNSD
jgi:VanZ family protein